jgi:hypothetical protein
VRETALALESCAGWFGSNRIDVDKSAYHHQSQSEISGDNACSRHLSPVRKCSVTVLVVLATRLQSSRKCGGEAHSQNGRRVDYMQVEF